jgi:hypothetical protein
MALTTCKECHKPVSRQAEACPHCGARRRTSHGITQAIVGALPALAVLWFIGRCSFSDPAPRPAQDHAAERAATVACQADLKCWAERHALSAGLACKPRIERQALYSVRWKASGAELFRRYGRSPDHPGAITYAGDAVDAQNAFGAWSPLRYTCTYDPESGAVLDVAAAPGRL